MAMLNNQMVNVMIWCFAIVPPRWGSPIFRGECVKLPAQPTNLRPPCRSKLAKVKRNPYRSPWAFSIGIVVIGARFFFFGLVGLYLSVFLHFLDFPPFSFIFFNVLSFFLHFPQFSFVSPPFSFISLHFPSVVFHFSFVSFLCYSHFFRARSFSCIFLHSPLFCLSFFSCSFQLNFWFIFH